MKKATKTNWDKVDVITDEEIDYTDSPEITEEMFELMRKYELTNALARFRNFELILCIETANV